MLYFLLHCVVCSRANSDLSERCLELEVELSRLKEQSIDHHSLLTTMAQDKETLSRYVHVCMSVSYLGNSFKIQVVQNFNYSAYCRKQLFCRAMSQNKELKTNVAELQDAFVKLSNQNMELASDLETERHHVARLKRALAAGEQLSLPPPPPPASETSVTESRPGTGQTTPTTLQATPTMPIVVMDALSEDGGGGERMMGEEVIDEVKGEVEHARLKEQEEQMEVSLSVHLSLSLSLSLLSPSHCPSVFIKPFPYSLP